MKKWSVLFTQGAPAMVIGAFVLACTPTSGPKTGTQTNWLTVCQTDADCGGLQCLCGTCTRSCGTTANCSDLPAAECVAAANPSAIALCDGCLPTSYGLCVLPCSEGCPDGTSCVAGVCSPVPESTASVVIDETQSFQTLVGIGAGLSYVHDEVAQHPRKAALYDAMFLDSGLTVLWTRNRYGQPGGEDLSASSEIVAAARERVGESFLLLLNSASPPASLKQNGSPWCEGNPETCTLVRQADDTFDYPGLGAHWRASLEAYAEVGIVPDYISIQNNPDWVPATGDANEACRFLPSEGTAVVATDTGDVAVEYPGYAEALREVLAQLQELPTVPRITAPDTTGVSEVQEYVAELDLASVDVLSHHLYGSDTTIDRDVLEGLRELGEQHDLPLFQSEMYSDPLTTSVLMHASFAYEGVSVYIQNGLIASAADTRPDGLINLTESDFAIGDPYHVLRHYSGHIGPGWVRVAAETESELLLVSAWRAPQGDGLVVVLTNPTPTKLAGQILVSTAWTSSSVTRTVLSGVERSVPLGALSSDGIITVPGQSIVTVTLED